MQENSTMFAKCDTIEEKESHDKLVHLAISEILSLSENQLQEVIRRFYAELQTYDLEKRQERKMVLPQEPTSNLAIFPG